MIFSSNQSKLYFFLPFSITVALPKNNRNLPATTGHSECDEYINIQPFIVLHYSDNK